MTNPRTDFYCGVDIGAAATKLVLLDDAGQVLARTLRHSGVDYRDTARQCLDEAQASAGLTGSPALTVATGYGRSNVDFAAETPISKAPSSPGRFVTATALISGKSTPAVSRASRMTGLTSS